MSTIALYDDFAPPRYQVHKPRVTHRPSGLFDEIDVDNFAGGGGASLGGEWATGRAVDLAINHDPEAVAMHRINHPRTRHLCQDVSKVDPVEAAAGRRIRWAHFSPDCTYHSKARGAKPIRHAKRKRRDLAWVVIRWAAMPKNLRPRIITLENVEEFADWGPLMRLRDARGKQVFDRAGEPVMVPDKSKRGRHFKRWVRELRKCGYKVEWRLRRACDDGAPTIRRRLFLIARCDGQPIVWPEPTHGPQTVSVSVRSAKKLQPYRTAASCIDFTLPCPSIFTRKKPLAVNTCKRIAKGLKQFVIDAPEPFIVSCNHAPGNGGRRNYPIDEPLRTVQASCRGGEAVVVPHITTYHGPKDGHDSTSRVADEPLRTQCTKNAHGVVAATLVGAGGPAYSGKPTAVDSPIGSLTAENHKALAAATLIQTGYGERPGQAPRVPGLDKPLGTAVSTQKHAVVAHLLNNKGTTRRHAPVNQPAPTVTAGGNHQHLIAAILAPYYGRGSGETGADLHAPVPTVTTKDRFKLVTAALTRGDTHDLPLGFWQVWGFLLEHLGDDAPAPIVVIKGEVWLIVDIGMRMLQPRELYNAQGFPRDYVIDRGRDEDGRTVRLTKTAQVRMCGNSVCPPVMLALIRANLPAATPSRRRRRVAAV